MSTEAVTDHLRKGKYIGKNRIVEQIYCILNINVSVLVEVHVSGIICGIELGKHADTEQTPSP